MIASMALDKLRSLDSRPYVHMVKAQTLAQQLASLSRQVADTVSERNPITVCD